jgi:hypothetical protein
MAVEEEEFLAKDFLAFSLVDNLIHVKLLWVVVRTGTVDELYNGENFSNQRNSESVPS